MKVALSIGHQSYGDQGAVSPCGIAEHRWWQGWAPYLADELRLLGYQVKLFMRENHGGSIAKMAQSINAWGADIALDLHLNSADSATCIGGHEVIYYDGSKKGKTLALSLDKEFDKLTELKDRNVRTPYNGRGDTFLKKTAMPAVIVEPAFLSVVSDVAYLKLEEGGKGICKAIAYGVHGYFQKGEA